MHARTALSIALALVASAIAFAPTASAGPCLVGPGCLLPTYDCIDGVQDCDGPPPEAPTCLIGYDGCIITLVQCVDGVQDCNGGDPDAPPCPVGQEDRCWVQIVTCVRAPCWPYFHGPLEPVNRLLP